VGEGKALGSYRRWPGSYPRAQDRHRALGTSRAGGGGRRDLGRLRSAGRKDVARSPGTGRGRACSRARFRFGARSRRHRWYDRLRLSLRPRSPGAANLDRRRRERFVMRTPVIPSGGREALVIPSGAPVGRAVEGRGTSDHTKRRTSRRFLRWTRIGRAPLTLRASHGPSVT